MARRVQLNKVFQESMHNYFESKRAGIANSQQARKRKSKGPEPSPKRAAISATASYSLERRRFEADDSESSPGVSDPGLTDQTASSPMDSHEAGAEHHPDKEGKHDGVPKANLPDGLPLTMCGNRPYSLWVGDWDGRTVRIRGSGTLFPEGYMPRIGKSHPWACPIRECHVVFAQPWVLGEHFSAGHCGCLLNDNLDGTMSVVGTRKADKSLGTAVPRIPAIVVSRGAIDEGSLPPKATPHRPERKRRAQPPVSPSIPISSEKAQGQEFGSMWEQLLAYLPNCTPKPQSLLVLELLAMKRQRSLPFRLKARLTGGTPDEKMFCAILAYLSGIEADTPCDFCTSDDNVFNKNFNACVRLHPRASEALQKYFGAEQCCNAFYSTPTAGSARNTLTKSGGCNTGSSTPAAHISRATFARPANHSSNSSSEDAPAASYWPATQHSPHYQGIQPNDTSSEEEENEVEQEDKVSMIVPAAKTSMGSTPTQIIIEPTVNVPDYGSSGSDSDLEETPGPIRAPHHPGWIPRSHLRRRGPEPDTPPTSVSPSGKTPERSTLEAQQWEMAPGRITTGKGASKDSIAFASEYLSHSPSVAVAEEVTFRVVEMPAGKTERWEADEGTLRVCSVAQGSVAVTLDETKFMIGMNGMWKVKKGSVCEVANPSGQKAVIHVTSIMEPVGEGFY